jgi:hypothetical protein
MQHFNRRLFATLLAFLAGSLVLTTAHAQASLVRVSGPSPFSGCIVDALTLAELGELNYLNAEVEPFVAVDARNPQHFVGVWQQDRWTFCGPGVWSPASRTMAAQVGLQPFHTSATVRAGQRQTGVITSAPVILGSLSPRTAMCIRSHSSSMSVYAVWDRLQAMPMRAVPTRAMS